VWMGQLGDNRRREEEGSFKGPCTTPAVKTGTTPVYGTTKHKDLGKPLLKWIYLRQFSISRGAGVSDQPRHAVMLNPGKSLAGISTRSVRSSFFFACAYLPIKEECKP